jgi:hypothetical protein
LDPKDSMGS